MFLILRILFFTLFLIHIEARALQFNYHALNNSKVLSLNVTNFLIRNYKTLDLVSCLAICNSFCNCSIVYYTQTVKDCQLYTFDASNYISKIHASEEDQVLLRDEVKCKYDKITEGLIHYWPLCNDGRDIVGNANLTDGVNSYFTYDRFGRECHAASLQHGYYKIPTSYYLNGNFTISAWVKLKKVALWSRLISFKNIQNRVLALGLSFVTYSLPFLEVPSNPSQTKSNTQLKIGQWAHLVGSINGINSNVYLNGKLVATETINTPTDMDYYFVENYLGRSMLYSSGDEDVYADISNVKIYNRALTIDEIFYECKNKLF